MRTTYRAQSLVRSSAAIVRRLEYLVRLIAARSRDRCASLFRVRN